MKEIRGQSCSFILWLVNNNSIVLFPQSWKYHKFMGALFHLMAISVVNLFYFYLSD